MADASYSGGSVKDWSGLRQGSGTGGSVVQGATPAVAVTAVAEAGKLRETATAEAGISGESGDSGLRWEGECEVTK